MNQTLPAKNSSAITNCITIKPSRSGVSHASLPLKLIVGGPGVWEFTILRDEIDKYNFDYIVQGEMDDMAGTLFEQIRSGDIDPAVFYQGYMTYDDHFRKVIKKDPKFLARGITQQAFPKHFSIFESAAMALPLTKPITKRLPIAAERMA